MDEQMNNNGYQSQPNPMPNQNKDNYAVAILVLGIVSICCCAPCGIVALYHWYCIHVIRRCFRLRKRAWQQQDLLHRLLVVYLVQLCLQFTWLYFVQQHQYRTLHIRHFCRIDNM